MPVIAPSPIRRARAWEPEAAAGDVDRHRPRALGARHGHVAHRPAALDVGALLAGRQRAQVGDFALEGLEPHRPQPEGEAPGEPGTDGHPHTPRREGGSPRSAATVATGARRPGTSTPIPSPMRRVRSAARARATKGSW